ncbi:immunity protein Imm33 domain-containing protein [Acinetobacter oleivorans]|uniref:Imm33-like domain-containing protein n=1 Tax=Acinetobacter oleivorans (strain JCM 16667 / KCTC 23045 / DR1) TaxID=436717 RepID=A0AAN0UE05_ACISD|nr:hypothetical protein [Acinetobacter oleivorans]ADI91577.1 hypothetical protein AOLE_13450 [Acinetobacter oleivorans DR1]ESK44414.1 hypothetical protein P254_01936 [Acinetobacter oleivorans CIP 110421]
MEEKVIELNEKNILMRYSSRLSEQAKWLVELIVDMSRKGVSIEDGVKIQFGWSFLIFRNFDDNQLILCEPDFSRNPFSEEKNSIDFTLEVQALQNSFAKHCGVDPIATLFQDKIILVKGCLDKEKLFMERIEPDLEKGDSGWFINTLEDDSEDIEYEAIYAFQLLYLRPEIMSVLILPPEFIVLVDKNTIEKVINEKNEVVWS